MSSNAFIDANAPQNRNGFDPRTVRSALLPEGALVCRVCGESFPMPGGDVKWVCAVANAFIMAHATCQPKKDGEE